ncbi:hypothetical protein QWZ16_19800 [Vibrio ostreicida]|uniref:Uncharacterized protein n=1 Tax=Vibrio ostreicida TaxID=526588 RepID=A0ABT8C0F9_9VIBR|nr:hypothetical protein [Vibrio ostreicida]MDN3611842.1 hypothetical protein [Vibrio ostreicida]
MIHLDDVSLAMCVVKPLADGVTFCSDTKKPERWQTLRFSAL